VPPNVVYSLTELGESLDRALEPLGEWGEQHMAHILDVRRPEPA
jgi:DNA-binding HxlR family transcriptional regulator